MDEARKKQILDILSGHYFRIKPREGSFELYNIALTHCSFDNGTKNTDVPCESNEKLEFFGNYLLDYELIPKLSRS